MATSTDSKQKLASIDKEEGRFFDLSIDMFCVAGLDGYFKMVNPAWEATLGFTPEEMVSRPFMDFIHPDDVGPTNEKYALQTEQGKDVIEFENRYVCKDGTYRWLLWNAKTVAEEQLIYAVARDVTEWKRGEHALERKAQELERSNAELEDFTHVVSHDLKEPLRGIEAFSGFLAEDYADKLDEKGQRYVSVLQESAVRMRDLIDDLLELSRIGRTRPRYTQVDIGGLLQDVRETLRFRLEEKGVELRVRPEMPAVVCDRVRMTQVFENLIGNAIKYNDRPADAWIEVTAEDRGQDVLFCVRDNGAGIDPKFAEKIFGIFQRLVRRSEHEGTGIGLTICKKIVEASGGEIWVESEGEGTGSAFLFTIPAALPAGAAEE